MIRLGREKVARDNQVQTMIRLVRKKVARDSLAFVALIFVLLSIFALLSKGMGGVTVTEIQGTVIRKQALPSSVSLDTSELNQLDSGPLAAVVTLSNSTFFPTSTNKDSIDSSTNKSADPSDSIPDSVSGPPPRLSPTIILPMNGNSSYARLDIANITHVPSKTRIEVHLNKSSNRRCQNPFLKGRLSGWSLSSIDFEFEDNPTDLLVVGVYDQSSMPVSGTYYLEIIIFLCERYSEEDVRNTTKSITNICLESPVEGANRITQTNASVHIQIEEEEDFPLVAPSQHKRRLDKSSGPKGQWLHKSLVETNTHSNPQNDTNTDKNDTNNAMVPLYTRYVPKECHYTNRNERINCETSNSTLCMLRKSDFCNSVKGVSQFQPYTYRWSDGPHEMLNRRGIRPVLETYGQNNTANSSIVEPHRPAIVCFVGASHAEVLQEKCNDILSDSPDISSLACQRMEFQDPKDLKESSIFNLLEGRHRLCTHVVIGLFQHPFSFKHKTIHFSDWKRDMTTVVEMFKSAVASPKNQLEKILLRSAHANAMGFDFHQCPARDYRTIPNAEMATSLLKEIVETHATNEDGKEVLSLVDTSFLIGPVWDSSPDSSHYRNEAGLLETKYILWKILREG